MARVLEGKPTSDARLKLVQMMLEDPEVADAYQELFGDLRLAPPLAAGNSILVTSTAPDEGKTTVSLCLAVTASCAGKTALLIDGDLRRSSLTAAIGGTKKPASLKSFSVRRKLARRFGMPRSRPRKPPG